jgi:hypothetical protein
MPDTKIGHLRADHECCECAEELDHDLFDCECPGYEIEGHLLTDAVSVPGQNTPEGP